MDGETEGLGDGEIGMTTARPPLHLSVTPSPLLPFSPSAFILHPFVGGTDLLSITSVRKPDVRRLADVEDES